MNKLFFIGIGGIGVSAMAQMASERGEDVSGSDVTEGQIVHMLREKGIEITIGQSLDLIPEDTTLVVYSNALKKSAPEFLEALKEKFRALSYPEYVAEVTKGMATIAIAGTHGKTTTTGMLSKIMLDASVDPTIIIGSLLKEIDSNFRTGKSEYLVLEADEYQKAFLNYWPKILVITNIAKDHLEFYGSLTHIQKTFRELAERVPVDGWIVCNPNDPNVAPILPGLSAKIIDYEKVNTQNLSLQFPGEHNRADARAALAVAEIVGIDEASAKRSLSQFSGTWRRFEYKGTTKGGAVVYDDYAHNPEKIRAALSGARELYPNKNIIAVFQPHTYSRTKLQFEDFLRSFYDANEVLVLPIFASREDPDPTVSAEMFVRELTKKHPNVSFSKDFAHATGLLKRAPDESIIVCIGAGDIYLLSEQLVGVVEEPLLV